MKFTKCSYIHCKSRHPGIYTPVIRFYAKIGPKYLPPGHAIVYGMRLCQNCAQTAKIHDIVTDSRWKDICDKIAAAGAAPPNRDTIELLLKGEN